MTMTIDTTNGAMTPPAVLLSEKRSQWLEEMKGKNINVIFEDCNMLVIEMNLKDKRLVLELKYVSLDQQDAKIKAKITEYNRFTGIALNTFSGSLSVGAALAGGPQSIKGGLMAAASQVFSQTKADTDAQSNGRVTGLDHVYQIQGTISNDHAQRMRSADDRINQVLSALQQLQANQQRAFEMALSGA